MTSSSAGGISTSLTSTEMTLMPHGSVDPIGNGVDDRHDQEQPRSPHRVEAAEAQDDGSIPLICDLDGKSDESGNNKGGDAEPIAPPTGRNAVHCVGENRTDRDNDDENEGDSRNCVTVNAAMQEVPIVKID
jgi:hypothetical protein